MSRASPSRRALIASALGAAISASAPPASANDGTIRELIPIGMPAIVAIPRPTLHRPPHERLAFGLDLRLAPVSFWAKWRVPEVLIVPQLDLDVVEDSPWSTTRVRFAASGRTILFPAGATDSVWNLIGLPLDLGGSVGFGGPSAVVGTGLLVGGRMATLGVTWRRAIGRQETYDSFTLDLAITYSISMQGRSED